LSEKEDDNIIYLSQKRQVAKENGITDEEFKLALNAIFGEYKGSGYNPE